jgi:HEPN domain-containing protein/predicted nucleotidyltransferase
MVRLASALDPALQHIVDAVRRVARPELVLLFGSRATGVAREDSDYDLMIVFADDTDFERAGGACRDALRKASIAADVLPRTISQYRRQQHDPGYLDWLVAREGRVLFTTGTVQQREMPARIREHTDGAALWRARAAADLRVARLIAGSPDPTPDAICFHAHAAVEKLLKAEIVVQGAFPQRTHDLERLLGRLAVRWREDAGFREACTQLQRLYPLSRYPEQRMPTMDEARRALAAAEVAQQRLAVR